MALVPSVRWAERTAGLSCSSGKHFMKRISSESLVAEEDHESFKWVNYFCPTMLMPDDAKYYCTTMSTS